MAGDVARLEDGVLYVNAASPAEDVAWAVAEALAWVWDGVKPADGVRPRHLKVVR